MYKIKLYIFLVFYDPFNLFNKLNTFLLLFVLCPVQNIANVQYILIVLQSKYKYKIRIC